MIGYSKAKLLGRPYRSGYEGEGTGLGGGFGSDPPDPAPAAPAAQAAPAMGPPTAAQAQAQAQAFAGTLSAYEATPADAVIVPKAPAAPVMGPPTAARAQAQAQQFAGTLSAYEATADSVIVAPATPPAPAFITQIAQEVEEALQGFLQATPNRQMPIADQYQQYGAGRVLAEQASGIGAGRVGGMSNTAGTEAQRAAFLSGATNLTPAEQIEAGRPGLLTQIGNLIVGGLGIASGTPAGVIGGTRAVAGVINTSGVLSTNPAASDLGFEGNLGAGSGSSMGSPAPNVFAAGGVDTGGMASGMESAPVLGFNGVVVGAPQTTTTSGGGLAALPGLGSALASLFAPPGNTRQLYGNVTPPQPAAPAIAPGLALAGLGALLFFG